MAVARFEIDKFDGKDDFELWKFKIKAFLGIKIVIKSYS